MTRHLPILLLAFWLCPAAAFDYAGISVGQKATRAQISAALDAADCGESHLPLSLICRGNKTVAGMTGMTYIVLHDSTVRRIQAEFDTGSSDALERDLMSRYGVPVTRSEEILWRKLGRRFIFLWRSPDGVEARYVRISGPFGMSSLNISTKEDRAHRIGG